MLRASRESAVERYDESCRERWGASRWRGHGKGAGVMHQASASSSLQTSCDRFLAVTVEAKAVDDGTILSLQIAFHARGAKDLVTATAP